MLQGRYRIERVLGAGSFGRVYLAIDTLDEHDSPIAVKELLDTHCTTPDEKQEAIAWFKREVSTLLTLDHPVIPAIHAYWTAQRMAGPFYLAMDYIPGPTMADVLQSAGPVAWQQVVEWGLALCSVLGYLHSRMPPVVFRDLKLPNVIIDSRTNQPVLIDFGITRQLATGSGTAIGSWGYAPYEQVLGRAEPRSDLYALGATLHALLTGRYPDTEYTRLQRGGLDVEATMRVLFPRVDALVPGVPSSLADVLACATAFTVTDRFPDAATMAASLRQAREDRSVSTPMPVARAAPSQPQPPRIPASSGQAGVPRAQTSPVAALARSGPVRPRRRSSVLARLVFWAVILFSVGSVLWPVLTAMVAPGTTNKAGSQNPPSHARHIASARPAVFAGIPVEFTALAFVSDRTGYAVGADEMAYKTTDGGIHWARITSTTIGGDTLAALAFPRVSTGYAMDNMGEIVLKTSDDGAHWRTIHSSTSGAIASLTFPTATTGYASVGDATLLKTTDGGTHWQGISPGGGFSGVTALAFPNVTTGYAAVDPGGAALDKTTDGGRDWNELITFPNDSYATILALAFPDMQTGYVALDDGRLLKTIDGGAHWQQMPNGPWISTGNSPVDLVALAFPSATTGYAVTKQDNGDGTNEIAILKTTDGGKRWQRISSTTASSS